MRTHWSEATHAETRNWRLIVFGLRSIVLLSKAMFHIQLQYFNKLIEINIDGYSYMMEACVYQNKNSVPAADGHLLLPSNNVISCMLVLKPLDNIGKTKKLKCSQIYT